MASKTKFLIASVIGNRTQEEACALIKKVNQARGLNKDKEILFLSDNLDCYKNAIAMEYAISKEIFKKDTGRYVIKNILMPENVHYSIVVKERNILGKIIKTKPKLIFGSRDKVQEILHSYFKGQKVNISFIERINLTKRQLNSRLARKSISYSKNLEALRYQDILSRTYYNFCLPHSALKIPLRKDWRGRFQWLKRTPAMAENITDHVWGFDELLFFIPKVFHTMT